MLAVYLKSFFTLSLLLYNNHIHSPIYNIMSDKNKRNNVQLSKYLYKAFELRKMAIQPDPIQSRIVLPTAKSDSFQNPHFVLACLLNIVYTCIYSVYCMCVMGCHIHLNLEYAQLHITKLLEITMFYISLHSSSS